MTSPFWKGQIVIDIIREVWRSLYKEAVDSDWSVICESCGRKIYGDEPDVAVECIDCFLKGLQNSVVLTVSGSEEDCPIYEVYDSPARNGGQTVGYVYDEQMALELAALARLHKKMEEKP